MSARKQRRKIALLPIDVWQCNVKFNVTTFVLNVHTFVITAVNIEFSLVLISRHLCICLGLPSVLWPILAAFDPLHRFAKHTGRIFRAFLLSQPLR